MTEVVIEIFGWVGAILLLFAYVLNLLGKLSNSTMLYIFTNLVGSVILIVNAYYYESYPFVLINVFWAVVSTYKLVLALRKQPNSLPT